MSNTKNIVPFICTLIITLVCLGLGKWQMERKAEKYELINSIGSNIYKDPIRLKEKKSESWAKENIFSPIILKGYFYLDKVIFLYGGGRKNLEDESYFVLVPFRNLDTDENFLVKLGKVETKQELTERFNFNHYLTTIQGRLLPGEKSSSLAPKNDLENNTWFFIDLSQAGEFLNLKLAPFYLDLTRNIEKEGLTDAEITRITPERHLVYAIIWFAFAAISVIIYLVYTVNYEKYNKSNV
jgi:cytochrome oxidase assembly protein ShyY1